MKALSPYLNFAGDTEDAFRFYQTVFGGELQIVRFRDFNGNAMRVPEQYLDESAQEAEKLFNALSGGGEIAMPLAQTEWAEKYGICTDKFGVGWMVNYTGNVRFTAIKGAST